MENNPAIPTNANIDSDDDTVVVRHRQPAPPIPQPEEMTTETQEGETKLDDLPEAEATERNPFPQTSAKTRLGTQLIMSGEELTVGPSASISQFARYYSERDVNPAIRELTGYKVIPRFLPKGMRIPIAHTARDREHLDQYTYGVNDPIMQRYPWNQYVVSMKERLKLLPWK
jgi:hypothetical protein